MGTRTTKGYDLDMTVDASLFGLVAFDVFSPETSMITSTMKAIKEHLWVKTPVGGIARYTNDRYQRVGSDAEHVPGNPWFLCTMWLAEYEIMRAKNVAELNNALPILEWVVDRSLASGVLAEQVDPYTNAPLSVSPLTWSHATFVTALMKYLEKREKMRSAGGLSPVLSRPEGFVATLFVRIWTALKSAQKPYTRLNTRLHKKYFC